MAYLMPRSLRLIVAIVTLLTVYLIWQFMPAGKPPPLPEDYQPKIAVWMGVTWSMDRYTDDELRALAENLTRQGVDDAFVYVSYLRADDTFNLTYDRAAEFIQRMRQYAPNIRWFAWIGVPISITQADGTYQENRLEDEAIRAQIADFAAYTITDLGFDGVHLNAELILNRDESFLMTLQAIRAEIPENTPLSTTVHALRPLRPVTSVPYPHVPHHWTPDYLAAVGNEVDQIALMAYDSSLPFPRDYRAWMTYQVTESAAALAEIDTELLIGIPTSEEWTLTHQTQAESLSNALYGILRGFDSRVDGIAIYPYWETSSTEWEQIQGLTSP
jgi:spore germination protein YaaH